jgi:hypothetical protein
MPFPSPLPLLRRTRAPRALLVLPVLAAIFVLATFAPRVEAEGELLTVEQMRADADFLHRALLEVHPDPYREARPEATEAAWTGLRAGLVRPLSRGEFRNLLDPVVAGYLDGHTYLDIDFDAAEYKAYGAGGGRFFPFDVVALDDGAPGGGLYVRASHGSTALPPGTRILSIDGRPADEVFADLVAASSGDDAANRRATAARLFPILLWQRRPGSGAGFALRVQRPGAAPEALQVPGVAQSAMEEALFADKPLDAYELTPQVYVVALNNMQANDKVQQAVGEAMATLRNGRYPVLVLDLRRNGGGSSVVGSWILRHIARQPFRYADRKDVRLSPWLAERNAHYRKWVEGLKADYPVEGDRIVARVTPANSDRPADDWVYDGKVYLLTSARTYSSGFMVAQAFQCFGMGTVVGEAPGSHRRLTGEPMGVELPNSGIYAYVATAQYVPPCGSGDFMAPDVAIAATAADLAAGRDAALDYVRTAAAGTTAAR